MATNSEVADMLSEAGADLAQALPNPDGWAPWIEFFLQDLERRALDLDPDHPEGYHGFLARLNDAITDRMTSGNWPQFG